MLDGIGHSVIGVGIGRIDVMNNHYHCYFIQLLVIMLLFLIHKESAIDVWFSVLVAFVIGNENNDFVCYVAACFFFSFFRLQYVWFTTWIVMLPLLICFFVCFLLKYETIECCQTNHTHVNNNGNNGNNEQ